jgi:hypothetical protein
MSVYAVQFIFQKLVQFIPYKISPILAKFILVSQYTILFIIFICVHGAQVADVSHVENVSVLAVTFATVRVSNCSTPHITKLTLSQITIQAATNQDEESVNTTGGQDTIVIFVLVYFSCQVSILVTTHVHTLYDVNQKPVTPS